MYTSYSFNKCELCVQLRVPKKEKNPDLFSTTKTMNPAGLLEELKHNRTQEHCYDYFCFAFSHSWANPQERAFIPSDPLVLNTGSPPYAVQLYPGSRGLTHYWHFYLPIGIVRVPTDFYDSHKCTIMPLLWPFLTLTQSTHQIWLIWTQCQILLPCP